MPLKRQQNSVRDAVALITGASDGIGAACARELRKRGAKLSLTGRSAEKLGDVAVAADLVTAADLTDPGTPGLLVQRTLDRYGRIDLLINNAGRGIYWPVSESPLEEIRGLLELNLLAPMALAHAAIPNMRERGSGVIVNVGSIAGRVSLPWMPVYSAAKGALAMLTESLRRELSGDGIHVMLAAPGYVTTRFQTHASGLMPPHRVSGGKRFAISPERCAKEIVDGIERRKRVVMTPRSGWLLVGINSVFPGAIQSQLAHSKKPEGRA